MVFVAVSRNETLVLLHGLLYQFGQMHECELAFLCVCFLVLAQLPLVPFVYSVVFDSRKSPSHRIERSEERRVGKEWRYVWSRSLGDEDRLRPAGGKHSEKRDGV